MSEKVLTVGSSPLHRRRKSKYITSLPLLFLTLPGVIYLIMFHYLPMFGVVIAFKDTDYTRGILGGEWIGFENFRFFFESNDAGRVIFSTMAYSVWFHVIATTCAIIVALLLFEITRKRWLRYFQTTMALPSMISWIIIAYIVYALLSTDHGLVNHLLSKFGVEPINWYTSPGKWPVILTIVRVWQGVGMNCVVYYAALMGLDESLFEAARLDGASRIKQIWYISLPSIMPVLCVMTILEMGSIMSGNTGIFYQVTMNSPALYPTTDIINTYILRGIKDGMTGVTAAVGLFQNVVGCILLITTNTIIRKISPENAMF